MSPSVASTPFAAARRNPVNRLPWKTIRKTAKAMPTIVTMNRKRSWIMLFQASRTACSSFLGITEATDDPGKTHFPRRLSTLVAEFLALPGALNVVLKETRVLLRGDARSRRDRDPGGNYDV